MDQARPGRDMLDRSLRTSWIVAATVALFLAPARPYDALAILAGQLVAYFHFIFLAKIVKLFTQKRSIALLLAGKVLVVYGGLLALIAWGRIRYAPLCAGFAIPFAVAGCSCMSPTAPALDRALASNFDSCSITAASSAGLRW